MTLRQSETDWRNGDARATMPASAAGHPALGAVEGRSILSYRTDVIRRWALALVASTLFCVVLVRTAWLCDDAFITLRTVDHFVHGRGLVWNLGERVQVYTHPLWMLWLSALYALSRNAELTLHVAGGLATAGFLAVLWRRHGCARGATGFGLGLALVVATTSKAFVEYSSSGLENPLTHLLVALVYAVHLGERAPHERLLRLALLSSLLALNRLDAILLVIPALAWDAWQSARVLGVARTLGRVLVGFLPLLAWECFALVYYGFPFPNTAYAKLSTGLSRAWYLTQGLAYWRVTAWMDPPTAAGLALGLMAALSARMWSAAAAMLLSGAYVVWVGGDFMTGRFLTPALAVALVCIARTPNVHAREAVSIAALFLVIGLVHPLLPLRSGTDYSSSLGYFPLVAGVDDERAYYYSDTGLLRADQSPARHPWAKAGRRKGKHMDETKPWTMVVAMDTIGFFGFYTDPRLFVVDRFALADPLLARLPCSPGPGTRIGHFLREVPAGYLETLRSGQNRIADPDLARLHDTLRTIVRGPLWSARRWRAIVAMNTGALQPEIDAYARRMERAGGGVPNASLGR